jgi:hypothetical protein
MAGEIMRLSCYSVDVLITTGGDRAVIDASSKHPRCLLFCRTYERDGDIKRGQFPAVCLKKLATVSVCVPQSKCVLQSNCVLQ